MTGNPSAEELRTKIYEAIGSASMCWSETPKGIFESDKAKEIADGLITVVRPILERAGRAERMLTTAIQNWKTCQKEIDTLKRENKRLQGELERTLAAHKNRGEAMKRPCINCGYVPKILHAAHADEGGDDE